MKIVFTGGGSGGHFYPIIAVSQELVRLLEKEGFIDTKMYYISNAPYNEELLKQNHLIYKQNKTGKLRVYFSPLNIFDAILTFFATIRAFFQLFFIYPDVVFSKGAYPSFPVTIAAWLLRIPIIIHESDSVPGRANKFAGKFAKRIAISYPEAAQYFPPEKVALTGNPIRSELLDLPKINVREMFDFADHAPIIFVTGGSQGAQIINDTMINAGPKILESYQIVHQVGQQNFANFKAAMDIILQDHPYKNRYKIFPYLDTQQMNAVGRTASLIISRGGSSIFEIAIWGTPSIIIPISKTNGDHQRKNAYAYARTGACSVIEEHNLTPNLFLAEINRVCSNEEIMARMKEATKLFAKKDAALKIAIEILGVLKSHLPNKIENN
ncbi:UDP-N-acetylglucosamine--N-acetylmuramyl-(pentapeptide) pyrophosphoryl-undecaprenol N-acetylglucosamine transferase [Patescibacteria group bacterium]|nr:UDP-N-acetylglucosamine--N-acetylmuramyl-(pentapeptide) pyrophosphoryl-undecaprenol N-acetylglucosamine transferase [Patescibacteria group bacterium]MBU1246646.1 UDP-N-acetylglucosamine--N-acetylmuramyl-(pentapeptide) pyrophosphoryl-undecaprenol N-acetylglucosamine transferase [Patescibacteria group bacterium]MBU1519252.1 UDP-N-acetylglucosamine--N-acetylmuramyl-(pentapeptide) pyrophosphoryl-undecaprenol N-acetylglucosamine transferase [Patescibacteria group bacterium]MBU1729939.1 UDP-N-acety